MPPSTAPPAPTGSPVPSPAESAGTPAAGAPAPTPETPQEARRGFSGRTKALLVLAVLVAAYLLYVISLQFFAYTSDAFVAADVVMVAPEVEGRIVAVHVHDNQFVHQGDPLIDLDPEPYELQARLRRAELTKAEADEREAQRAIVRAQADRATAGEALGLARRTEKRYADLVTQGAASQLIFDEAQTRRAEAEAKVRAVEATLDEARQKAVAAEAAIVVARRAADLAAYNLEQTHVVAPVDGQINNLWLRIGDYAREGIPRVGLVASDTWWVVALYKEDVIRHLREGQPVWVHLDLYPWRLLRGRVQGIARGIAREDRQDVILPEIAPTTGWIRFQRRFPVRITLEDLPDDVRLLMGANARTLVVYGW